MIKLMIGFTVHCEWSACYETERYAGGAGPPGSRAIGLAATACIEGVCYEWAYEEGD